MANASLYFKVETLDKSRKSSPVTYNFIATIKTCDNVMLTYHTIMLGGNKQDCVNIIVNEPKDERFASVFPPSIAKIPHLSYSTDCCLSSALDSGEGTRHMIRTALKFTKSRFPAIQTFELTDASKFQCADGIEISLAHYSIAIYGKTWYERHFNAIMKDERVRGLYSKAVEQFTGEKPSLLYEILFQEYYFQFEDTFLKLKPLYEKSNSISQFIQAIKTEFPEDFCNLTHTWLEPFVNSLLGKEIMGHINQDWVIEYKTPRNLNVNVTMNSLKEVPKFNTIAMKKGGGRNVVCRLKDL